MPLIVKKKKGNKLMHIFLYIYIYTHTHTHTYYWNIFDLQCFQCTARWFSYRYTHILFLRLFSTIAFYKILTIVPCDKIIWNLNRIWWIVRKVQEGGDVCIPMADSFDIWQKSTHYCKTIMLQLKIIIFIKN